MKKPLTENFIFCAVTFSQSDQNNRRSLMIAACGVYWKSA